MKKPVLCILLIMSVLMTATGCSIEHNVSTNSSRAFKKDLMGISDAIKSVEISFRRPAVIYKVNMTKEPTQETLDTILGKVKSFTTVENMDEIARKVGWKQRVSQVYLRINTDKDDFIEHEYFSRYYKTAVVEDREDNIDAYQTWKKSSTLKETDFEN